MMLEFLWGKATFIPASVIDEIWVHCCMKCPQILREKTSSQKYTVIALRMWWKVPAEVKYTHSDWKYLQKVKDLRFWLKAPAESNTKCPQISVEKKVVKD